MLTLLNPGIYKRAEAPSPCCAMTRHSIVLRHTEIVKIETRPNIEFKRSGFDIVFNNFHFENYCVAAPLIEPCLARTSLLPFLSIPIAYLLKLR
jgi:hypothetical protein